MVVKHEKDDEIVDEYDPEAEEAADDYENDKLSNFFETLSGGDDIEIKVYRILKNAKSGKRPYLFKIALDEAHELEEILQQRAGSGEYEVRATDVRTKRIKTRGIIAIESLEQQTSAPVTIQNESNTRDLLMTFMSGMKDMIQANEMANKDLMLQLMSNSNSNKSEGPSINEIVGAVAAMKELAGGNEKASDPISVMKSMMGLVTQVKEFADPPADSLYPVLQEGLKTISGIAMNTMAKGAPGTAQPKQPVNTGHTVELKQPKIPQEEQPTENLEMMRQFFTGQLNFIYQQAVKNRNPITYAELLLDQVPESFYPQLVEFLGVDNKAAWVNLQAYISVDQKYVPWFAELFNAVRDNIVLEDDGTEAVEVQPDLTDNENDVIQGETIPEQDNSSETTETID